MTFVFFNDTATTEIYTLSLHDALPIWSPASQWRPRSRARCTTACRRPRRSARSAPSAPPSSAGRSEEHTSELQSRQYIVCRLLLEKKKIITAITTRVLTKTPYSTHHCN